MMIEYKNDCVGSYIMHGSKSDLTWKSHGEDQDMESICRRGDMVNTFLDIAKVLEQGDMCRLQNPMVATWLRLKSQQQQKPQQQQMSIVHKKEQSMSLQLCFHRDEAQRLCELNDSPGVCFKPSVMAMPFLHGSYGK